MNSQIPDIQRLLRNLICIGTVVAVNLDDGLCRVATGNTTTGWLHWLTTRAGKTRTWNAPSVGEQAIVPCLGGAVIEYEPENGALKATDIQTATIQAAESEKA
ncbi:Baseplate assembly protein V GpV [Erwinia piriflorinigrans CFBP 5888]|uniref:Baseplate assembly protein V GpV n=1 Tax=Erwinia piriflorinigrans CFBP 5888 TaxID=1161919 RepID=V5ZAQ6_9GAMM|nr:Baseplate assembly protein V GpV [Erwinia piriflorinigrans CFBP 5888]